MKVKVNRKWKWKESESEISLLTLIYQESLTSESGEDESESGPWLEEAATFIAMEAAPNTTIISFFFSANTLWFQDSRRLFSK